MRPVAKRRRIELLIGAIAIIIVIGLVVWNLASYKNQPADQPTSETSVASATLNGGATKTSACQIRGKLPDPDCTPGAILEVSQGKVCAPRYAHDVRNVPNSVKEQVYREYGITSHQPHQYEVDHLVSLELGGSNDIANLWPEAAEPRPGFHEKDAVENKLHREVCIDHTLQLGAAQQLIAYNWQEAG